MYFKAVDKWRPSLSHTVVPWKTNCMSEGGWWCVSPSPDSSGSGFLFLLDIKKGESHGQLDPTSSYFTVGLDPKQALWFSNIIYKACFSFSPSLSGQLGQRFLCVIDGASRGNLNKLRL